MRRIVIGYLLFIIFLFPLGDVIAASPNPQTTTAAEVIDAVNAVRFQNSQYPFIMNTTLMDVAQLHSNYQAAAGEMTHVGPNGSTSTDRALSAGYGGGQSIRINEMVYSGTHASSGAAIEFWLSSEIHKPILLSNEYHQFGVGVSSDGTYTYITVNVGLIMGVTSAHPLVQATPYAGETAVGEISPGSVGGIPVSEAEFENQTTDSNAAPDNASIPVFDPEASNPGLLENTILLWTIIVSQFLVIAGLAYYIINVHFGRLQPKKSARTPTVPLGEKPFEELPHEEQFERLEKLAHRALERYEFEEAHTTPLQYRLNATFQVEALPRESPDGGLQKYLLRINSPNFQTEANILSEMQWLAAIRRDTNLVVPDPIMTNDRKPLTTVDMDGVPGPRHAVVLRWIEGKMPSDNVSSDVLTKLGAFIGQLHLHAEGYNPPAGFERKQWDLAGFSGEMLDVPVTKARRALSAKQLTLLEDTARKIGAVTDELGRDPQVFGLIHGNLHERNYLIYEEEIRAIDFDMCGWGYFLYDLAVTFSTLIQRPDFPKLKNALLDGYRQVRRLPPDQETLIVPFIAARFMTNIYWLAGHKYEPTFVNDAPRLLTHNFEYLEQFSQRI